MMWNIVKHVCSTSYSQVRTASHVHAFFDVYEYVHANDSALCVAHQENYIFCFKKKIGKIDRTFALCEA
jgi:hypothetical protein